MDTQKTEPHLAYCEAERKHAFGVFSGCPCHVNSGWTGSLTSDPMRVHPEYVDFLKRKCDGYVQKDRKTYSNWNRNVKMSYGEWQSYGCAYLEHDGSCHYSLKQERSDDADFQDAYMKEL